MLLRFAVSSSTARASCRIRSARQSECSDGTCSPAAAAAACCEAVLLSTSRAAAVCLRNRQTCQECGNLILGRLVHVQREVLAEMSTKIAKRQLREMKESASAAQQQIEKHVKPSKGAVQQIEKDAKTSKVA